MGATARAGIKPEKSRPMTAVSDVSFPGDFKVSQVTSIVPVVGGAAVLGFVVPPHPRLPSVALRAEKRASRERQEEPYGQIYALQPSSARFGRRPPRTSNASVRPSRVSSYIGKTSRIIMIDGDRQIRRGSGLSHTELGQRSRKRFSHDNPVSLFLW